MGDKSHTKMDGNWQLYRSTRVRERKIEIKYVLGDLALRVRCFFCVVANRNTLHVERELK
jgi:hypothetical protein